MLGGQDCEPPIIERSNGCRSEKENPLNEVFEEGFEVDGDDEAELISSDPPKEFGDSGQIQWGYDA